MKTSVLNIFDKNLKLICDNSEILEAVLDNFGFFEVNEEAAHYDFEYQLKRGDTELSYTIIRNNEKNIHCENLYYLIYWLEKDITVEMQYVCQSLFFMHGAALEKEGEILLLTGASGAGKSTTTWGLLNNGFNYLSDELAPINLETMHVSPYPHAVCLKSHPPLYPLPKETLKTAHTMHVPANALPCKAHLETFPLTKVIIVEYSAENEKPVLTKLSRASACMHIYTNGLNQLAHEQDGLTAASKISENCECYSLAAAKLDDTCELINSLF